MHSSFRLAAAALAAALLCAPPAQAADDDGKPMTRAETEALVKKVIADNPQLLIDTVEHYQMQQQATALSRAAENLSSKQGDLQNQSNPPSIGNPKGDVTIVEFFDYHCGYCKHFFPELSRLLSEDKNVRVVFREFPILSEDSDTAAQAALAVNSIDSGKYFAYHTALMKSTSRFDLDMLTTKAREVGIDEAKFKKAMGDPAWENEIKANRKLAQELNISGTPAIIIGTELVPGAIGYDDLKEKVEAARKAKDKS